jgi:hypothetical protein
MIPGAAGQAAGQDAENQGKRFPVHFTLRISTLS